MTILFYFICNCAECLSFSRHVDGFLLYFEYDNFCLLTDSRHFSPFIISAQGGYVLSRSVHLSLCLSAG